MQKRKLGKNNLEDVANVTPARWRSMASTFKVGAPDFTPFNGDPQKLYGRIVNLERINLLAPRRLMKP
jgi:hypothetical protein